MAKTSTGSRARTGQSAGEQEGAKTPRTTATSRKRERQAQRDELNTEVEETRKHLGQPQGGTSPQARYHYTVDDKIDALIKARESEPVKAFMNRVLSVCALPRRSMGKERLYVRRTDRFMLALNATHPDHGLPYGTYPRLLFAWICTEAVRTQTPRLVLGRSLTEFLDRLGLKSSNSGGEWGVRKRFSMQMQRLFACAIHMEVQKKRGDYRNVQRYIGGIAELQDLWWDPRDPEKPMLWTSTIELNHRLFKEIIEHAVPLDMNILRAIRRSPLGIDLYLWITYRTFLTWKRRRTVTLKWTHLYEQFASDPSNATNKRLHRFRAKATRELGNLKRAWPDLNCTIVPGTSWKNPGEIVIKPTRPRIAPIKNEPRQEPLLD